MPTLKRSKDEIDREIKVIDKVRETTQKYIDEERVYVDTIQTMGNNINKLSNVSLEIFEHKKLFEKNNRIVI